MKTLSITISTIFAVSLKNTILMLAVCLSVKQVTAQPLMVSTLNTWACDTNCNGQIRAWAQFGTPPYTYSWSNGQTTSVAIGLCPGIYSVVATDASGTTASSSTSHPFPFTSTLLSCGVCGGEGKCFNLPCNQINGGMAPYSYSWSPDPTLSSTSIPNPIACAAIIPFHSYTLTIKDANGCTGIFVEPIAVYPPATATFTYSINGGTVNFMDLSTVAIGSVVAWNWIFPGGTPASSTLQNPGPIIYSPGTYTVCLITTTSAACNDTACQTITITSTGINDLSIISSINIFPTVSSSGIFTVSVSNLQIDVQHLDVYDVVGKKIFEGSTQQLNHSTTQKIDLSSQKDGIYFVQILSEKGVVTKKVIIAR